MWQYILEKVIEEDVLKEKFKNAIASTVRAVSENKNLEINFGNQKSAKKNSLHLPDIINTKNTKECLNLRAYADSESLRIRYNNGISNWLDNFIDNYLLKNISI